MVYYDDRLYRSAETGHLDDAVVIVLSGPPTCRRSFESSPFRTLAARKAFDEPISASIRRKHGEASEVPAAAESPDVVVDADPVALDAVRPQSPPPPQDEPVDFSTKPKASASADGEGNESTVTEARDKPVSSTGSAYTPSFTSTRELKFARNLKLILMEIFRKHPAKARMVVDYIRFVGRTRTGIRYLF